ncbi:MAG: pitrilysin family protein [Patescibacteria group bacterium]|nr:MAG: pitrilysin family protein [Patescibacteria group bacterium]
MKFKKHTLKNGLRIITVPMPETLAATVLVLVEAGSKYETKDVSGVSHFLEHMCFKGTAKRPKALDIVKELDGIGAQYNAFTGQEYTGYWAKAGFRQFPKILDVVSDIYLNPLFDRGEIEKEKGVIVEEINMYEDMPARHVQDLFMELLYGDQPAGWNIAGEKRIVKKLTKEDFVLYRGQHYVASATTIVVAGRFDEKKILGAVKKKFSTISSSKKYPKKKVKEAQSRPRIMSKYKKTDQTHLVIGFRSYSIVHKRNLTLAVLAGILGGGMSSRLFQKIREEMGVGYYVRAYNDPYTDHGIFQASVGVDNRRVREVIGAMLGEFRKLKEELVSDEELKKVKDHLIGSLFLELESSDERANFYGMQEVLKKSILSPREMAKRIRSVTPAQIRKVARDIFKNNGLNMAFIGPNRDRIKLSRTFKL